MHNLPLLPYALSIPGHSPRWQTACLTTLPVAQVLFPRSQLAVVKDSIGLVQVCTTLYSGTYFNREATPAMFSSRTSLKVTKVVCNLCT